MGLLHDQPGPLSSLHTLHCSVVLYPVWVALLPPQRPCPSACCLLSQTSLQGKPNKKLRLSLAFWTLWAASFLTARWELWMCWQMVRQGYCRKAQAEVYKEGESKEAVLEEFSIFMFSVFVSSSSSPNCCLLSSDTNTIARTCQSRREVLSLAVLNRWGNLL